MNKQEELQKWLDDDRYVQAKELAELWGMSRQNVNYYLQKHKIQAAKTLSFGLKLGMSVFYERAECERARPFINQPEQKEVEKVEQIRLEDLATKNQIMTESGATSYEWDKATTRHKIKSVKNYCDNSGRFMALFNKNEVVSAILEYKNLGKSELEKCLSDDKLITTRDLEKMWKLKRQSVYQKIYKLGIKPHKKIKLENGYLWHFYKKSDCIEPHEAKRGEQKSMELPEQKEPVPDIIPADTVDIYNLKQLEAELQNRGVEFTPATAEIIRGSDMPEMVQIAKMLDGDADSVVLSGVKLGDIAALLRADELSCIEPDLKIEKKAGRKSKYIADFDKKAFEMASENKSDKEIMSALGISRNAFYRYKENIDSFSSALSDGRGFVPAKMATMEDKLSALSLHVQLLSDRISCLERVVAGKDEDSIQRAANKLYEYFLQKYQEDNVSVFSVCDLLKYGPNVTRTTPLRDGALCLLESEGKIQMAATKGNAKMAILNITSLK